MAAKIHERERSYRKRILAISPVSLLVVFLLVVSVDYVPFREIEQTLGWKGALRLLPEITIIPETDPFESFLKKRNPKTMASLDLNIINETGKGKGGEKENVRLEEEKNPSLPEEANDLIRTYPAHTDVPYSEDYVIIKMVQPEYPPEELLSGIEGDVVVELLVNDNGTVEKAWILSATGPPSFEKASLHAVKQFIFQPPIQDGKPTAMWIRFFIKFRILG